MKSPPESDRKATMAADWQEWQSRCAADRCGVEVRDRLKRFGAARFEFYCRRYAGAIGHAQTTVADLRLAESKDAWHLLETRCHVGRHRSGKSYKQWLFARAEDCRDWTSVVEAGATLLMRDVVRANLRQEHHAHFMRSLDAAQSSTDGQHTWNLAELIPDPTGPWAELEQREAEAFGMQLAAEFIDQLSLRERILVVARSVDVSFYDRRLQHCCGCSKSSLAYAYRHVLLKLGHRIREQGPDEETDHCLHVLHWTLEKLVELILDKKLLDEEAARFFKEVGVVVTLDEGEKR